jgi:hypothetical protein
MRKQLAIVRRYALARGDSSTETKVYINAQEQAQ